MATAEIEKAAEAKFDKDSGASWAVQRYGKYLGILNPDDKLDAGNTQQSAFVLAAFAEKHAPNAKTPEEQFAALHNFAMNTPNGAVPPLGSSNTATSGFKAVADDVHKEQTAYQASLKPAAQPQLEQPKVPKIREHHRTASAYGATDGDVAFEQQFAKLAPEEQLKQLKEIDEHKINTGAEVKHEQDMLKALGEDLGHKNVDGFRGSITNADAIHAIAKLEAIVHPVAAAAPAAPTPAATTGTSTPAAAAPQQTQVGTPIARSAPQSVSSETYAQSAPKVQGFADKNSAWEAFRNLSEAGGVASSGAKLLPYSHEKNGEAYLGSRDGHFVARYDMDHQGGFELKEVYDLTDPKQADKYAKNMHDDEKRNDSNYAKLAQRASQDRVAQSGYAGGAGYDGAIGGPVAVNVGVGRYARIGPVGYERGILREEIMMRHRGECFGEFNRCAPVGYGLPYGRGIESSVVVPGRNVAVGFESGPRGGEVGVHAGRVNVEVAGSFLGGLVGSRHGGPRF